MNKQDEIMMNIDLLGIQESLRTIGLRAELLEKSEVVRLSTLLIAIDPDESGRSRQIALTFIPLPEDTFDGIKLLQFQLQLPFSVPAGTKSAVEQLFNFLNLYSVIGTFAAGDDHKLSIRYIHTLAKFANLTEEAQTIFEILKFLVFTADTYSDPVELVAGGLKTAEEVVNGLRGTME